MPSLAAHFQDDEAEAIEKAAATSPQKKIGPWITEACRLRLLSEGRLPGSPEADARAEFDATLAVTSPTELLAALRALRAAAAVEKAL